MLVESHPDIIISDTLPYNKSYCSIDPFPKVLIEQGFVSVLAKMARMTYGNTNMPKFCIQSLVRIISNVDVLEAKTILTELLEYNVIDLISISLRSGNIYISIDSKS